MQYEQSVREQHACSSNFRLNAITEQFNLSEAESDSDPKCSRMKRQKCTPADSIAIESSVEELTDNRGTTGTKRPRTCSERGGRPLKAKRPG